MFKNTHSPLMLLIIFAGYALATRQAAAKLSGVVADPSGARVPNATVYLEGNKDSYKAITRDEGTYHIEMPPGIYHLRVESVGFEPMRRAAIRLGPSSTKSIDVLLLPMAKDSPWPKYDTFYPSPGSQLDLLIRYREDYRWKRSHLLEYKGSGIEYSVGRGVMLTYDALTIYASTVRLDTKSFKVEAENAEVLIADGNQHKVGKHVEADFKAENPIDTVQVR